MHTLYACHIATCDTSSRSDLKAQLYSCCNFWLQDTQERQLGWKSVVSMQKKYNFPALVWNAAKLYDCFAPEWDNPPSWINFSWFALTFLSPSTYTDLIRIFINSALPPSTGICLTLLCVSYLKHHSYTCLPSTATFYSCGRLHCFFISVKGRRVKSNMLAYFQYAWQQSICASASHTIFSIPCITVCNRCFPRPLLLPVTEPLSFHWDIFALSFLNLWQLLPPILIPSHVQTRMYHSWTGMCDTPPSSFP